MPDAPAPISARSPSLIRRLWLHALFIGIIAVECIVARVGHRSDAQLRQSLENGTARQRVYALFVLSNRGTPQGFDRQSILRLVNSDAALVREWTMTANFARLGPTLPQEAHIMSLGRATEATRCRFLLDYRPVVGASLELADVRRFLDALAADS